MKSSVQRNDRDENETYGSPARDAAEEFFTHMSLENADVEKKDK